MTVAEITRDVTARLGAGDLAWFCPSCDGMWPADETGRVVPHDPGGIVARSCPGSGKPPVMIGGTLWHWTAAA
jgi:hypothetical protein